MIAAPNPLIKALCLHPFDLVLNHLITIPLCDKVKDTNTPTAYNGNNKWFSPLNIITNIAADTARSIIPLE
ncbi:hypothetical protein D3C81_575790 [compost metagenome]